MTTSYAIHGRSANGNGRDVNIMRIPARSLSVVTPLTRKHNRPFIDALNKRASTAPIPCAPPSKDEISDLELEKELQEMYIISTWQMYHRIQSARRRGIGIGKAGSNLETQHQSISTHSCWPQESSRTNSYNDDISQFKKYDPYDQPFAFNNFEL